MTNQADPAAASRTVTSLAAAAIRALSHAWE
jgi:hypothetical protein